MTIDEQLRSWGEQARAAATEPQRLLGIDGQPMIRERRRVTSPLALVAIATVVVAVAVSAASLHFGTRPQARTPVARSAAPVAVSGTPDVGNPTASNSPSPTPTSRASNSSPFPCSGNGDFISIDHPGPGDKVRLTLARRHGGSLSYLFRVAAPDEVDPHARTTAIYLALIRYNPRVAEFPTPTNTLAQSVVVHAGPTTNTTLSLTVPPDLAPGRYLLVGINQARCGRQRGIAEAALGTVLVTP